MINRKDIHLRDPYVVPVIEEKKYYLFGTTDKNIWGNAKGTGFDYYTSYDLETFKGPYPAFRPEKDFWSDQNFWAPEVFYHNQRYYMFASFKGENQIRGVQVLSSEKLSGPYKPIINSAITPQKYSCIDGTLYLDENQVPWILFSHGFEEKYDGEICAMPLSTDLKSTTGKVVSLFKASEIKWTKYVKLMGELKGYIADGPYIYKTKEGRLLMIWSSFDQKNQYATGIAYSTSGSILGPWVNEEKPIYSENGGHGMLFTTFENELMLAMHGPNDIGFERPLFLKVHDKGEGLEIDSINR